MDCAIIYEPYEINFQTTIFLQRKWLQCTVIVIPVSGTQRHCWSWGTPVKCSDWCYQLPKKGRISYKQTENMYMYTQCAQENEAFKMCV